MDPVPAQIIGQTKNTRLRQSMLLGSALEGGWKRPFPVGDNGTSFGPYQLHEGGMLTSLGLTPQQAENPRTSTKAMLPAYSHAVNQISDQLWRTNPQRAAEEAARIAERPSQDYYASKGKTVVAQDWHATQAVLKGKKGSGGMPTDANLTSFGGLGGGFLQWLLKSLIMGPLGLIAPGASGGMSSLKSDAQRFGLVIFGGLLVLLGIAIFAFAGAKKVAGTVSDVKGVGSTFGIGGGSEPEYDPAKEADKQRRQEIATRSLDLGERKLQLAQQKEDRLALGRPANPSRTSHQTNSKWHREHGG